VQTKSDERGVLLSWPPPAENRQLPAIAYVVERDGGGQTGAAVTAKPIVPGVRWDAKVPLLLDRNAPANEMLTYRVYCVDAFGRRSEPAQIKIFFPDFHALEPPQPVTAASGAGKIVVNWPAAQKPNLAGYLVERSMLFDGPYEALQAQALPPSTAQYEDDTVQGGTTYYYRVRAVNSRGDLGTPSTATEAQAKNPSGPPKVDGLAADVGQTRVRLTWKAVEIPVAGYFVERRVVSGGSAEQWVRLNARVTPEPLYDDRLGLTSDVSMEYRVLAVAFDNAEGAPSNPVQAVVPDRSIPEPPSITASSGEDGKVQISFVPALPTARTANFLVLRSGSDTDLGVVIGDPLAADARQFTDLYVSPGERYWYRLVAVGANGNRSDPTRPVAIRVGSPQMAAPAAPAASYTTDPYPHIALQFALPPAGLSVIVERQDAQSNAWIRIAGPMSAQSAVDNKVPASGSVSYRISYVSADGKVGPASPLTTVSAKR
jgi:predicted phage tail protein